MNYLYFVVYIDICVPFDYICCFVYVCTEIIIVLWLLLQYNDSIDFQFS